VSESNGVDVAGWVQRLGSIALLTAMAGGTLLFVAEVTGLARAPLGVAGATLFLFGTAAAVTVFVVQARASSLSFLGVAWRTLKDLVRWLFWMLP